MRELIKGVTLKRMPDRRPVIKVHYSAHPERGPAWVKGERAKYSNQSTWDSEQEVIHEAGGGERIFADVLSKWADKILVDPQKTGFQVSPHWKLIAGFDHGKANPTAALLGCIDFDGNIYILSEYYQPGLSPKQHVPNLEKLDGFLQAEILADPSIFYASQAQSDGHYKALSQIYEEEGIVMGPALDNTELLGMERILAHWHDLENNEPTLKIICPRNVREIQRPVYGIHNEGCPNLLWELRRCRREELSAVQLVRKNPTEKIVDRDNHLRDCLKYLVLSLPEPSRKSPLLRAQEAIEGLDATSAMIRWNQVMAEAQASEAAPVMGRRGQVIRSRRK